MQLNLVLEIHPSRIYIHFKNRNYHTHEYTEHRIVEAIKVAPFADHVLRKMNAEIGELLKGQCVFINCPLIPPLDDEFRVVIEEVRENNDSNADNSQVDHLIVVLETQGGFMETVERMVSVMRSHYDKVSFVIPNYAFSAGTVLVLSGDEIFMDYYSVLGPIDPQEPDLEQGGLLPGVGYLEKFKELTRTINNSNTPRRAELTYLVKKFDPARLFRIEQSINHGISLITKWLTTYKFKDWNVSDSKKSKRATKIARILGNAKKWHSHGRGISIKDLMEPEIKLKITDFGKNEKLNQCVRHYHGFCVDHFSKYLNSRGYVHSSIGVRVVQWPM